MGSKVVNRKRLELKDDPTLLSPPQVDEPLYQCATAVTVRGYVPNATVEVQANGTTVASVPGGAPWPNGVTIPLPNPLVAGDKVRARQKTATAASGWSAPVTVRDHTQDYPAGPPRPQIDPAPVYECGVRTGVSNLLTGGNMWITANMVEVGRVNGCATHQGVNVNPPYGLNQKVRAWFELCKDPSPPSVEYVTTHAPNPLPAPTIDPFYAGGTQITVRSIVNGSKVTLYRNGLNQGTWPCWGYALSIGSLAAFSAGEVFSATQTMCPSDPPSPPGSGTGQPCSALPAPQIGPVQGGDTHITLTDFVPDAVIRIYLNGALVGVGSGPVVLLTQTVKRGDTLVVVQDLAACQSQWATTLAVPCIDAPIASNPAWLDLFPVGWFEYDDNGRKGIVYYPADDDGKSTPFNKRLGKLEPVPIVFMAHGNHDPADPSYLGYDYFQRDLAKLGVIAVSVDCNALNGPASGVQNIEDRADLIIDNIAFFKTLNTNAGSVLFKHIDFSRTGLMGHSRGGDAVVTAPTVITLPDVTIRSVLALAPTNFRFWFGLATIQPSGYAFMTILPAGDGDVRDNNGAQFYDQAKPRPFRSQLYVHYTNHNFFNRQWAYDDSLNYAQPPVIARAEHERILTSYGSALFRATLLSHNVTGYLDGHVKPAGVMSQHVYLSFHRNKALVVDNHQDGNTINTNSLGRPTTQLLGMSADEFQFGQVPGAFNGSFYGESIGMVVKPGRPGRIFRSELKTTLNLLNAEVWIRAAEVTDGSNVPAGASGFELGLEDDNGARAWVDSDDVGGLPRPYARNPAMIKTMLSTLRFKVACFSDTPKFNVKKVEALLIRATRKDERALSFDDLHILK
jgi:hypothetical protein